MQGIRRVAGLSSSVALDAWRLSSVAPNGGGVVMIAPATPPGGTPTPAVGDRAGSASGATATPRPIPAAPPRPASPAPTQTPAPQAAPPRTPAHSPPDPTARRRDAIDARLNALGVLATQGTRVTGSAVSTTGSAPAGQAGGSSTPRGVGDVDKPSQDGAPQRAVGVLTLLSQWG